MALRLIEMVLTEEDGEELGELLKKHKVLEHRQIRLLDGEVMVRILLDVEQSEAVLDLLEKRYTSGKGNRLVILPVAATLPRVDSDPTATSEQPPALKKFLGVKKRPRLTLQTPQPIDTQFLKVTFHCREAATVDGDFGLPYRSASCSCRIPTPANAASVRR